MVHVNIDMKKKSKRDIHFLLMIGKALYQFFYVTRTFIWILYCCQNDKYKYEILVISPLTEKIFHFLHLLVSIKTFSNIKLKFTSIRAAQNTKRSKDNLILESAGKVDWHLFGMELLLKS